MKNNPAALDTSELHKYPGYLVARARWHGIRNFERAIGRPLSLRPVEFSILVLLDSNSEVSQAQLAQALGVAAPNMTGILRRLQQRGLVDRAPSQSDGRVQVVALTAKGSRLIAEAKAAGKGMDKAWLGRLTRGEQALLCELLAKLAQPPEEKAG